MSWLLRRLAGLRPPRPADSITILMPCKHQKHEYFLDAVRSVVRQTSPYWELLVLTDPESPPDLVEWVAGVGDERVKLVACPSRGFAQALNHGLACAQTDFVCILLSDDRYAPNAIRTLQVYRRRFPEADFFHSARRHIDHRGEFWGPVMASRASFDLAYFQTSGSPVKHLLCWRREKALAIGGMNERLSVHGCDDYDFPWRMAEAGAQFRAVKECLYEYRIHHEHDRLTTTVPIEKQVAGIRRMFEGHGVNADDTDRYLQRARNGYLIAEFTDQIDRNRGALLFLRCFREANAESGERFVQAGFKLRHWFPHRVYVVPKGGPDGMKLARRMAGCNHPDRMREFVLYATPPVTDQFPREMFYDDDLVWHQQQFGIDGQIACANVLVEDGGLRCYLMISDIVQRASRAAQYRTRIDNRFAGWNRLLLNAVLQHAAENRLGTVWLASANLMLRNADPKRSPELSFFSRIYDEAAQEFGGSLEGDWWRLNVQQLRDRIVLLERHFEVDAWPKTVCIIHDVERGLGHLASDPEFARVAERASPQALQGMLDVEARLGVRATYNLVGVLLPEVGDAIRRGGHALAFHSYDHQIPAVADGVLEQFRQCRLLDYRLKGYRLPQSKLTPGITDTDFAEWNFEWMAGSRYSLGTYLPDLSNGVVKVPVHVDDYAMFREGVPFEEWQRKVMEMAAERDFLVIGLHDCYAHLWLPHYEQFLRKLQESAAMITVDEVAARVTVGNSRWFEG